MCDSCQRIKASRQQPAGLLQPLPVPLLPWDQVALAPVKETCTAEQVADVFLKTIYSIPSAATERANQVVEDMLRAYAGIQQETWDAYLHFVEFAYNNAINSATGQQAREHALAAQNRQAQYANCHRRHVEFQAGDYILLSTRHIQHPAGIRKLSPRYLGPYVVVRRVGQAAYELALPPGSKNRPVFHVSLLKVYRGPPPAVHEPVITDEGPEYEVEAILRHHTIRRRLQFLVLWRGFPLSDATWEPLPNPPRTSCALMQHNIICPCPSFKDKALFFPQEELSQNV